MALDEKRRFVARVLGKDANTEHAPIVRTSGTVTAVNTDGTVSVKIRADPTPVANAETDSNYVPVVGDNVHLEVMDGVVRVLGKSGSSPSAYRGIRNSVIVTSESRSSSSYGDLATVGPFVVVTVGDSGVLRVGVSGDLDPDSSTDGAVMSYAFSGTTTTAASDAWGAKVDQTSAMITVGRVYVFTSLTPGSYTITAKYRSTGGASATFANRVLWAEPL